MHNASFRIEHLTATCFFKTQVEANLAMSGGATMLAEKATAIRISDPTNSSRSQRQTDGEAQAVDDHILSMIIKDFSHLNFYVFLFMFKKFLRLLKPWVFMLF